VQDFNLILLVKTPFPGEKMNIENKFLSYINRHAFSKNKLFYLKETTSTVPDLLCSFSFLYNEEEYIVKIVKMLINEEDDILCIKDQIIDLTSKGAYYDVAELFDPLERRIALTNFVLLENSPALKNYKAFCEDVNKEVNFDIDRYLNTNFYCAGCIFFDLDSRILEEPCCRIGYDENNLHLSCVDCPGFISKTTTTLG